MRLIMQQTVQQMVSGFRAAVMSSFIHTERQAGNRFRDHPNAGVHSGQLNGCLAATDDPAPLMPKQKIGAVLALS